MSEKIRGRWRTRNRVEVIGPRSFKGKAEAPKFSSADWTTAFPGGSKLVLRNGELVRVPA